MSRRPLQQSLTTFSSSLRASSRPRIPSSTICIHQQARGLKYESYEERRQLAKEWAATVGKKYMRPRKGKTNYLQDARDKPRPGDKFSLQTASQGQDGLAADEAEMEVNPWDDGKAIEGLKTEHNLSESDIESHRRKHRGITPTILSRALSEKMEDAEIAEAIRQDAAQKADAQFNSDANNIATRSGKQEHQPRAETLRPFPENRSFISQPVLSEELREMIYLKVVRDGLTVRTVSTLMGVSMERVGAVVRMKQMERDWVKHGKPLAVPYSKAVLDMLPTTPFLDPTSPQNRGVSQPQHEPINELPIHPATTHQTFVSVPESRAFTRADAAKAFSPHLKSSDERIPHPELLEIERFKLTGKGSGEVSAFARGIVEREQEELKKLAEREARRETANLKTYEGKRWQFKFQDVSVEDAGRDGRSKRGVGWRYGMPHEDRKRGQVKIPTRV